MTTWDETADTRREEIERLLGHYAGRLIRGRDLSPAGAPKAPPADPFVGFETVERHGGRIRIAANTVPTADGGAARHERGYRFHADGLRRSGTPHGEMVPPVFPVLAGIGVEGSPCAMDRLAFIDTETTGVMGMSGTLPFLVGLGYFRAADGGWEFTVEQYFIDDHSHEGAMLSHLRERLEEFDAIVSFNGRAYDLPLLEARFIMNRMRLRLEAPHLDLLTPARRLYRERLGSCSLGSIERGVLGIGRTHDIPGSAVPRIYLDYVHRGRVQGLREVFDHNAQDIISLGALLWLMAECAADPEHPAICDCGEALGWGAIWRKAGDDARGAAYLERAAAMARTRTDTTRALHALAGVYRRLGRTADAAEIWRGEVCREGIGCPAAVIELAKLLEWGLRDYAGALAVVCDARKQLGLKAELARSAGETLPEDLSGLESDLGRRLERLERRRARSAAGPAND